MLIILAFAGYVPLGIAFAQPRTETPNTQVEDTEPRADVTAATKEKATTTPKWVVLRLIDSNGQPVSGARVAPYAMIRAASVPDGRLDGARGGTSAENGQVLLTTWDAFLSKNRSSLYILHEERGIGAVHEIVRGDPNEKPPIVLEPVCHVRGVLDSTNGPTTGMPLRWANISVRSHSTILHGSLRAGQRHDFEVLLPSGKYTLFADGSGDKPGRGPCISDNVRVEKRAITVTAGQRDLDIGTISLRPTKVSTLMGLPAPEIGPMKEWRNGSPVTLADLRGQIVWLHFGGQTPFVPVSLPGLADLHNALGNKGLTIIAIYNCASLEELDRRWTEVYERHGGVQRVPFRIAIDGGEPTFYEGTSEERPGVTHGRYDITRYPTDVFVDQAGNIFDPPESDNLKEALSELLGLPVEKPPAVPWQPGFHEVYRLEEGQIIKHIAPPFIPERTEYFRNEFKRRVSADVMIPSRVIFHWDGGLTRVGWTFGNGSADLESTLTYVLGLKRNEYEGPQDLLRVKLPGDWIVRDGAHLEAKLLAIEGIIAQELGRPIRFERRSVERDVIVATGMFRLPSSAGAPGSTPIHLYSTDSERDTRASRGIARSVSHLLRILGNRINMPVLDQTEPTEPVNIPYHDHPAVGGEKVQDVREKERRLQALLDHLTAQTNLQFEVRTEPLPIWYITEQTDR